MEGFGDPFCRACFDWGKTDNDMHAFFRDTIAMRKNSPALLRGEFAVIYGEGQTCGLLRDTENEYNFILINTDEELDWYASVELGRFGSCSVELDGTERTSENGRFTLHIEPMCFRLYHAKTKQRRDADA